MLVRGKNNIIYRNIGNTKSKIFSFWGEDELDYNLIQLD